MAKNCSQVDEVPRNEVNKSNLTAEEDPAALD